MKKSKVLHYETPIEVTITMDGTEKTLFEKSDSIGQVQGYVDLTPMQGGDTIVLRQYMKVKTGGSYAKYNEDPYSGVQAVPLIHLTNKTTKTAVKMTAQQTAGANRSLDCQFFRIIE